jgi:hypothetical protein
MAPCCGLEFESVDVRVPMPPSLGALQLVTAVENVRGATAHPVPGRRRFRRVGGGAAHDRGKSWGDARTVAAAYVSFSPEDAKRRFISENSSLWADIEADLKLQLAAQNDRWPVADRVRGALVDLMPAGRTGAEDVARALGISRSTLQRRLARGRHVLSGRFWMPRGATWRSGISPRPPCAPTRSQVSLPTAMPTAFREASAGGRARRPLAIARHWRVRRRGRERRSRPQVFTARASEKSGPPRLSSTP